MTNGGKERIDQIGTSEQLGYEPDSKSGFL
jgi:hypothetical protein